MRITSCVQSLTVQSAEEKRISGMYMETSVWIQSGPILRMQVAHSSRRVVIPWKTTREWAKDTAEAKESLKDCLRSEITSNALTKIRGKDRSGSDGDGDGGTSASGDNFGFYRWLKSNLLRAVVFSPWRISRHLSGRKFTLRRRWKFVRNRKSGHQRRFFALANRTTSK